MEKIKETQTALLSLLKDFDSLCKKAHIHYTLHGGTMLGAIRNHGFIPWDDDLDIAMRRKDYDRLRKCLKKKKMYTIVGSIKKQFRKTDDNSCWIDIFICDSISENLIFQKIKLDLLTALDIMNRDPNTVKLSNVNSYNQFKQIVFQIIYSIGKLVPSELKVHQYNNLSIHYLCGNRTVSFRSNDQYKGRSEVFPAKWLDEYILIPFENTKLPVIKNYHDVLVKSYGENYMIPVRYERTSDVHDMIRSENNLKL